MISDTKGDISLDGVICSILPQFSRTRSRRLIIRRTTESPSRSSPTPPSRSNSVGWGHSNTHKGDNTGSLAGKSNLPSGALGDKRNPLFSSHDGYQVTPGRAEGQGANSLVKSFKKARSRIDGRDGQRGILSICQDPGRAICRRLDVARGRDAEWQRTRGNQPQLRARYNNDKRQQRKLCFWEIACREKAEEHTTCEVGGGKGRKEGKRERDKMGQCVESLGSRRKAKTGKVPTAWREFARRVDWRGGETQPGSAQTRPSAAAKGQNDSRQLQQLQSAN